MSVVVAVVLAAALVLVVLVDEATVVTVSLYEGRIWKLLRARNSP